MRTPEEKARQEGIAGSRPGALEYLISPETAKARQEGYNDHLRNQDLADQINRGRNTDTSSDTDDGPRYWTPPTPHKQADPDATAKKVAWFSLSFLSLAVAYLLLTTFHTFSFLWWLGVVAVILGIPAILIAAGVAAAAGIAFVAFCIAMVILTLIYNIILYFIANPM